MIDLKSAYRQVGWMCKHFMTKKRSKQPKDLFTLERAYKELDSTASMIQLENQQHIEEVINDKSITKDYYSTEIQHSKKYLGLMQLGIEYLKITAQYEDMNEADKIMHEKVEEEIKEILRD